MADESLHEIQLNGKQLVFLFMSATVVAVVIFLAGVMVGRGVKAPEAALQAATPESLDPTATGSSFDSPAAADPTAAPATSADDFSYPGRLGKGSDAEENLKPVNEPVASAPEPAPTPAPAPVASTAVTPAPVAPVPARAVEPKTSKPAVAPATQTLREPSGSGFVVQVAATRDKGEADGIARRLVGKGYPAFVTTTASGPRMFRVRVGKYRERRDAASIAAKLESQEQFKPWVTN